MKVLLAGGSGYLGGFIAGTLGAAGHAIVHLARRRPATGTDWQLFDLADPPRELPDADALVHAAFDHVPGRYRGGEGDDPEGFLRRNRDGSLALFEAAARAGIGRVVFLSTRAVYGAYPPGTILTEALAPRPDTLYGEMKHAVEGGLAQLARGGVTGVSLRVTGVYGQSAPGGWHKWQDLFAAFEAGAEIVPRMGTEVHGADMADAVRVMLTAEASALSVGCFNVSDIRVDRHDLLSRYAALRGLSGTPPPRAPTPGPNAMDCTRLRALGWSPGGASRLERFLAQVAAA